MGDLPATLIESNIFSGVGALIVISREIAMLVSAFFTLFCL